MAGASPRDVKVNNPNLDPLSYRAISSQIRVGSFLQFAMMLYAAADFVSMAQIPVSMALSSSRHCPARPSFVSGVAVVSWTSRNSPNTARCFPPLSKSVNVAVRAVWEEGDSKIWTESSERTSSGETRTRAEQLIAGLPTEISELGGDFSGTGDMGRVSRNLGAKKMQHEMAPWHSDYLSSGGATEARNRRATSITCDCRTCGRRGLVASLGAWLAASQRTVGPALASKSESSDYNAIREAMHPARPTWYQELYAQTLARTMDSYEAEMADYKHRLFHCLDKRTEQILELGIGTGPNLKYYGQLPHLRKVIGLDPNMQMARYCKESASSAGLSSSQFEFLNAVGEGIPVPEESVDAVVCTLTLCSVTDVQLTLEEVKRVLKPGGAFLFVEHVAAPDGSALRFWQGLLDPLQQWVADNCHLQRSTLKYIELQFGALQSETFTVKSVSLIGPHIMGVAYK